VTRVVEADFFSPSDLTALFMLLRGVRDADKRELLATRGKFEPVGLSMEIAKANARVWLVYTPSSTVPAAAFGYYRMTPTCAGVFAFGTDFWPLVVKGMTRRILRDILPLAPEWGLHRAECRALASRQDVRRWLLGLGWKAEAVLSEFGVGHEDFVLYAWTAPHEAHQDHPREHQGLREFQACDA
jgi:hypothetical protein